MRKGDRHYTTEEKSIALELYRQGLSSTKVEACTGVGFRTVNRLANSAGISRLYNINNLKNYVGKTGKESPNWRGGKTVNITNREYALKNRYGITVEDYNKLFQKQGGCCYLCGKHQSELNYRLCVDHNHKTNKIRGLLCKYCNHRIGWFEQNKEKIINYLQPE